MSNNTQFIDGELIQKKTGTILKSQNPIVEAQFKLLAKAVAPTISEKPLPENFDGRVVWKGLLSPVKDQKNCGSCYGFASTAVLADRFAIFSLGKIKVNLSPAQMVTCAYGYDENTMDKWRETSVQNELDKDHRKNAGCQGASLFFPLEFFYTNGVPEESCFPYIQKGDGITTQSYNIGVSDDPSNLPVCKSLEGTDYDVCPAKPDTAIKKYRTMMGYAIDSNEKAIMYDIYKYGPVLVGMMVYDDFMDFESGKNGGGTNKDIYMHPNKNGNFGGHALECLGWGTDRGVNPQIDYWIIRNSWSDKWGDKGFFKMQRGMKDIQLEQNCAGLIPDIPGLKFIDMPFHAPSETAVAKVIRAHPDWQLSPEGLYPTSMKKIRENKLKGDMTLLPKAPLESYDNFWAGLIDEYRSSNPIMEIVTANGNIKIYLLIIIVIVVMLIMIYYKNYK